MPEDMARSKEAGFDGYITKPFRVMSLLRDVKLCVQTFLERQKAAESSNPITEEIKKSSVTEEIKNERTNEPTQPMEDHPGG
jgi:AmiR/NasT family two-component response regulator